MEPATGSSASWLGERFVDICFAGTRGTPTSRRTVRRTLLAAAPHIPVAAPHIPVAADIPVAAVAVALPVGLDCLDHRMRRRTRPPGGQRSAGRRNTNSHRPTTNSRSVPSDTHRDRHVQAPKQHGRNGVDQSGGECPLFPAAPLLPAAQLFPVPNAVRPAILALPDPFAGLPALLAPASVALPPAPAARCKSLLAQQQP